MRVVVEGRVQGVFFRDSVRRLADQCGVSGFASNRPDGSLEVVVEGEPAAVERIVEFCRRGPPRARVERLACLDETPEGLRGFRVR